MNFYNWEGIILLWVVFIVSTAVVHIAFAYGVYTDAEKMKQHLNRNTAIVSPIIWTLGTLIGGVFVAGMYWLIHHSTFNPVNVDLKNKDI